MGGEGEGEDWLIMCRCAESHASRHCAWVITLQTMKFSCMDGSAAREHTHACKNPPLPMKQLSEGIEARRTEQTFLLMLLC